MFRRRVPLSFTGRVKEILWPRKAFRGCTVIWCSAYCGCRVQLTRWPADLLAGLRFLYPFGWVSFVACLWSCLYYTWQFGHGILGTIFGNPWTFPLIFVLLQAIGKGLSVILAFLANRRHLKWATFMGSLWPISFPWHLAECLCL